MQVSKKLTVLTALVIVCFCSQAQEQPKNPGLTVMQMGGPTTGWTMVSGVISDAATGKPLSSINVSYKDRTASITDVNGLFALPQRKV